MGDLSLAWIPALPPTLWRLLTPHLQPVPTLPAVAVVLAAGYLAAAITLWLRRRRWPVGRTVLFLAGCLLLAGVMGTTTEGYGYRMFSVFMFQQLTLMIAIPPLLVLGAPYRLTLRALPHTGLGRILLRASAAVTFSRPYRWVLHPAFGIPLFLFTYYGLYLSNLGSRLLSSWSGHNALEVGFLISGILFAVPILTTGPGPIHPSYLGRMFDMFAEMALHAFFGVLIMLNPSVIITAFTTPPTTWGIDPLTDQQTAGGLAWSYGEGPAAAIVIYLMFRWFRHDTATARAADRNADRNGDPELAAYNQYLAQLATHHARSVGRDQSQTTPSDTTTPRQEA